MLFAGYTDVFLSTDIVADGECVMKMYALASQGRLNDINRDVVHEFERTSSSRVLPEVTAAGCSAGADEQSPSSAVDYVSCRRSTTDNTSWLDDVLRSSDVRPAAPLQRLEQLDSELASLNHARRRLAVDDDRPGPGNSSSNTGRSSALPGRTTQFDSGQGDANQSDNNDRKDYAVASGSRGELNISPWISSSLRDVASLQRRQMCGGSVLSTSTIGVINCLQSLPLTTSTHRASNDAVFSRAIFTDSRCHAAVNDDGAGSPSTWRGSPVIDVRTWTGSSAAESRLYSAVSSACPRTPPSPWLDSAIERPSPPSNGTNRLQSHYVPGTCAHIVFCSAFLLGLTNVFL